MKAQKLVVKCFFNDDGASIQDLIYAFFSVFLKRKLGIYASASDRHV